MTTLESIGFTIAGGSALLVVSLTLFGLAVVKQHPFIAPRATARPSKVIYNPSPSDPCQDRGNPILGWIPWTLKLSYDTLLRGIPGTGTRNDGLSGSLLKVNLDGIILLRFHALGLRVTALATILLILFALPMFYSAQCYRIDDEDERRELPGCASLELNLTNYDKTTIANVPSLADAEAYTSITDAPGSGILARLYFLVFIFWIIAAYMCHQLKQEWIHVLAMRRVYWLEYDIWKERKEELKSTLLYEDIKKQKQKHFNYSDTDLKKKTEKKKSEKHLIERDPWIPHPEQRDTVPNVALYSVLVGGLPSLPEQAADSVNAETTLNFSKRESIDWQLSLTGAFFDHCVPNQPGFSSSVVAVTIIPSAKELGVAWKKWYHAAAVLRKTRFLRAEIERRVHYDIEDEDEEVGPLIEEAGLSNRNLTTPRGIYTDLSANKDYFRQVLGSPTDNTRDSHIFDALNFGPEQAAVYSREFAQAAAKCCPNGCFEGRVLRATIDELRDMEKEATERLHEANLKLREARHKAAMTDSKAGKVVSSQSMSPLETKLNENSSDTDKPESISRVSSTDSKPNKGHRRNQTIESAALPEGLGLEATLYKKVGFDLANKPTPVRRRTKSTDVPAPKQTTASLLKAAAAKSSPLLQTQTDLPLPDVENALPSVEEKHQESEEEIAKHLFPEKEEAPTTLEQSQDNLWARVESIVAESKDSHRKKRGKVFDGSWEKASFCSIFNRGKKKIEDIKSWTNENTKGAIEKMTRETTYAVVTFSSRQAAVAARHCLADGRGTDRWVAMKEIPIPPLADAASCDILDCRNCCRPVTLSITDRQKTFRNYCALALLGLIYFFYTIPLSFVATTVGDPGNLEELFPKVAKWANDNEIGIFELVSGFLSALTWSLFFALCPIMFKSIANFGSKAYSAVSAEYKALQYFWWFMLVTAFSGTLITNMLLQGFNDGLSVGSELRTVLREIARTIPSSISAAWLNWVIFRVLVILPLNYLLQINTFIFHYIGWKCCSRLTRGGGPGSPVPYRIYVDSAVVLLCAVALAPQSPLLAPACFLYFLVCQPLLRRNLIFVYKPKFDGGGLRFPFIFDMSISALIFGNILLVTQMGLKQALGPFIAAIIPFIFIYLFRKECLHKYKKSFDDAALLQTSLLDGWDTSEDTSSEKREEFRRFLVDAHKAAYVPVCIAGTDTDDFLTSEPAVVVPLESDLEMASTGESQESIPLLAEEFSGRESSGSTQHGAMLRRSVQSIMAMRRRFSSVGSLEVEEGSSFQTGRASLGGGGRASLDANDKWMSLMDMANKSKRSIFVPADESKKL